MKKSGGYFFDGNTVKWSDGSCCWRELMTRREAADAIAEMYPKRFDETVIDLWLDTVRAYGQAGLLNEKRARRARYNGETLETAQQDFEESVGAYELYSLED